MKELLIGVVAVTLGLEICAAEDAVFLEDAGVVAIEAESTASRLGSWVEKTDVEDFSGTCHLEFTGNKPESGPPKSPLNYRFKVKQAGKYSLTLRGRKRLETKREDISNDCFVSLKGDFSAGGQAPLNVLKEDTKMYGGNADGWGWTQNLDTHGKKFAAIYQLKAGEIYELTISGRSKNFNIDRILLVHESRQLREAQRENPAESKTEQPRRPAQRIKRTLTNAEGVSIDAELLSKSGDTVSILVRGARHDVKISTLSEEDQKFIAEWEP